MQAIVDTREYDPFELADELNGREEITDVEIRELPCADIVIGGVAFERKRWPDFVGSMTEKRLSEQVDKMADAYEHRFVLIDESKPGRRDGNLIGVNSFRFSDIGANSVMGYIGRLTADGTPVIPCTDTRHLVWLAVKIAAKVNSPSESAFVPTGDVGTSVPVTVRMLASINGIGPKTAEAVYERFGTIERVGSASVHELTEVEGVGESTAKLIIAAITVGSDDDEAH